MAAQVPHARTLVPEPCPGETPLHRAPVPRTRRGLRWGGRGTRVVVGVGWWGFGTVTGAGGRGGGWSWGRAVAGAGGRGGRAVAGPGVSA